MKERETGVGGVSAWNLELGSWLGPQAPEAASPLPSLPTPPPCDFMWPNPVARFHKESCGECRVGSGTQPRKGPQLSLWVLWREEEARSLLKQSQLPPLYAQQKEVAWALWSALRCGTQGGGSPSLPLWLWPLPHGIPCPVLLS